MLKPEAEKALSAFSVNTSLFVERFIRRLSYVATVVDVEKRSESSTISM